MLHHIDHRFTLPLPPDEAQAVFNEQVASELASQDEFKIVREEPGLIVLNDDTWRPEDWEFRKGGGAISIGPVSDISAGQGLHVDFQAAGDGTAVHVHGHADKSVREALEALGTPGHWPEGRLRASGG